MGGQNPYIQEAGAERPQHAFQIDIIDEDGGEHTVEVDPGRLPYGVDGLSGSLLDICLGHGIELDHACGGVCACSTCHVHVLEGLESCNEPTEDEEDQLEQARDLKPESRLGCQCVPNGSTRVRISIPSWNRNLTREPHGTPSTEQVSDSTGVEDPQG